MSSSAQVDKIYVCTTLCSTVHCCTYKWYNPVYCRVSLQDWGDLKSRGCRNLEKGDTDRCLYICNIYMTFDTVCVAFFHR